MKVGIIQSNYIPWRGYFDFIDDVDLFIFYDDVQYTKNDWRNRNKIKTSNGLIWLTVPVLFKLTEGTLIQDAKIDYRTDWIRKHMDSIRFSYCKSGFYKSYSEEFFELLNRRFETISELNVNICRWVMEKLDIATELKMSSEFHAVGSKTDRLIDIIKKAGATSYLSGPAAKNYLEVEKFKEAGIGLEYKTYEYLEYPQLHGKFEPSISMLDLLFNCGKDSRKYLKSIKPNEKVI
jgi:hypothetical protein